jgi:DNA uptake protein ComE-like DNA-binding protein
VTQNADWKELPMKKGIPSWMIAVCALGLASVLAGCDHWTGRNDEQLRQKSAQATRDVRQGAKQLTANAKTAAGNAVNGVNAMTQGIKDGMNGNQPGDRVDINSASTARLVLLPGISIGNAQEIVKGRPYRTTHALVDRGVLTQEQYDRIANQIAAK